MAHQADKLPWETLASIFELKKTNSCQHDAYNLHTRIQPDSREKLADFLKAFMKKAVDDAIRQRKLHPEKYEVPNANEVIITDEIAKRITPTVRRCNMEYDILEPEYEAKIVLQPIRGQLCPHTNEGDICECPLRFKERKMSAFQHKRVSSGCYRFMEFNGAVYRNLEVVKTLLIHCEMEPILRACADQNCQLARFWATSECHCMTRSLGWFSTYSHAIKMYLILNIIYCFPEMWNNDGSPVDDYRNIKAYQRAIWSCTKSEWDSDVETYPHRDFFGIEKSQFTDSPRPFDFSRWKHIMKSDSYDLRSYNEQFLGSNNEEINEQTDKESQDESNDKTGQDKSGNESSDKSSDKSDEGDPKRLEQRSYRMIFYPYGLMSYEDFLNFENPVGYQPHSNDTPHIRWILGQKGLPTELSDDIIEYADYVPTRSLPLFGKPLHPQCRTELDRYLEQCWQIIVSCIMLGHELKGKMEPEIEANYSQGGIESVVHDSVKEALADMFSCGCDCVSDLFRRWYPRE